MNITIQHGLTGTLTKQVPDGTTFGAVVNDPNVRSVLGYGENVRVLVDGAEVDLNDTIMSGDTIVIERQAAAKA